MRRPSTLRDAAPQPHARIHGLPVFLGYAHSNLTPSFPERLDWRALAADGTCVIVDVAMKPLTPADAGAHRMRMRSIAPRAVAADVEHNAKGREWTPRRHYGGAYLWLS